MQTKNAAAPKRPAHRRAILIALVNHGLSVSALARQIKKPRNSVSIAIHTGRCPGVTEQIRERLNIGR